MGSIGERRKEQILSAFFKCVARYGLHDATVARVAEEANLERTLVYHYFGNRKRMIDELIIYSMGLFSNRRARAARRQQTKGGFAWYLDYFFGTESNEELVENAIVSSELAQLGIRDKHVAQEMDLWVREVQRQFEHDLANEYPDALERDRVVVAHAFGCLISHAGEMRALGPLDEEQGDLYKEAAERLLSTLETSPA